MSKFKQPNKVRRSISSVDGFVPNSGNIQGQDSDIRKRFSSAYSPNGGSNKSQSLNKIKRKPDNFESRNDDLDTSKQTASFDMRLDDEVDGKKSKKHRSFKKKLARGMAVSFLALLIAVSSLFAYGYLKTRQIFRGNGEGAAALQDNVDPSQLNGEGDGRVNILLLGKGGPGHEAPDLTDTILLASIDPIQNEAALLSVPRDFYVKDPNGYSTKINAIYSNKKQVELSEGSSNDTAEEEGLKALKQTVSEVLGVPIHYNVMVNFDAFQRAIDTVGGITIDVKEPLYDSSMAWLNNGNPLLADEGLQTFDGKRALYYARSRYGSARGDFDRTERQREVIVATQQKVLSLGTFSNPLKVIELMGAFGDNVRTDLNGAGELKRLYEIGQNIGSDRVQSVGLADPPNQLVTTDNINGQSIVRPVAGLYQYDDIQSYVRNTLRDAFLKQEDARVIILNGTDTPGLATATEKELKSYGYNVVGVDNAPTSDYSTSRLIDLSEGQKRYTKSYLERRLGLTSTYDFIEELPTNETADFVIILGEDEALKTTSN